jgi:hypothetical protein
LSKKLISSTIVSKGLYVARSADNQLKTLINDMGRPGYILVARQMGKTNLLVNARRELEDDNHVFVYVDLSNHFSNSRACFRNIIDIAVETHSKEFNHLQNILIEKRKLSNLPPHKEHELELRLLLRNVAGKIIILLDEIDTLTKSDYSDEIFAQIRSIYFSRVNFPEYDRLSYVLSGVAEPSEIIKDKNISPFNIGEKIYLDDFTYDEFLTFLKKAGLQFDSELCARIFYWANGNPRITWDICSEIENITENKIPNIVDVDTVVQKLYLTDFDKAPIDHIRNLVAGDRELKNAIIQIKYNKGSTLNDDLKRKLYLAGITKACFATNEIKIKNRVIEESLSAQWIENIDNKEKDLSERAEDKFKASEFGEAAKLYEEFLQINNISDKEKIFAHYQIGLCYLSIKQYQLALDHLTLGLYEKESYAEIYQLQMSNIALCQYYLGNYESSITTLKQVINETKNELWCKVALNLAGAYYNFNFDVYKEEILQLNNSVLEKVDSCKLSQELIGKFKGTALHNLGQAFLQTKDIETAKQFFLKAADVSSCIMKPKPLLEYIAIEESIHKKKEQLNEIQNIILKNQLKIESTNKEELNLDSQTFKEILLEAFNLDKDIFRKLIDYSVTSIHNNSKTKNEIIFELGCSSLFLNNIDIGKELIKEILLESAVNPLKTELYCDCYKFLYAYAKSDHEFEKYSKYFDLFEILPSLHKMDVFDISNFEHAIVSSINQKNYLKAQKLINLIKSRYDSIDEELKIRFLKIFYYEMRLHQFTGDVLSEQMLSRTIIKFINESDIRDQQKILKDKELSDIFKYAKNSVTKTFEISQAKKYERNERVSVKYLDGTILKKKYKHVEQDLKMGKCTLLQSNQMS